MKHILLAAFAWLQCLAFNHAQTYKDTTFTDPVVISFAPDFVTFENCRFVGINGVALYIEGSGVLVSDCTFEDINATAIYALGAELYLVSDTFTNVNVGVTMELGALVVLDCSFLQVKAEAVKSSATDVTEVSNCKIREVGAGIFIAGNENVTEVLVDNNTINQVGFIPGQFVLGDAIHIMNAVSVKVSNNVIDSCSAKGIYLQGSILATTEIQNNKISRTNETGIYAREGVQNGIIKGNEVSYTGMWGGSTVRQESSIRWSGPNARIEGNHLHHSTDSDCVLGFECGSGIIVTRPALISKNLIHDCAGEGILYITDHSSDGASLFAYNNIIYDVDGRCFYYDSDGSTSQPEDIILRNNTFHGEGTSNVLIDNCTRPFFLEGNILMLENNPDTGSYVNMPFPSLFLVTQNLNLKSPGDLGFVNFAGRDFHLADESSPAHKMLPQDFGLPNDDFDGEIRLGLRDAGADELNPEEVICGCNNCPSEIDDFFTGDFTFSVVSAANNDLSTTSQGVCGVRVEFEHQYLGDLSMELISPAGQKVQLIGPNGFFGSTADTKWNIGFAPCLYPSSPDPGFSATWNSNQLWGQSGSYSGIYYPATGCLEDFNQGTVTGDWTLRVFDNQSNDGGTVLGFEVMFCDTEGIDCFLCSGPPVAGLSATNVGSWGITLQNISTGAPTSFQIDFGDGQSAFTLPIFHEYENPGAYLVRLIASNDCGVDTSYLPVQIFGAPPQAFVFVEPEEGCTPLTVQAKVIQEDHVDTWHWIFPGGIPSESFEREPTVVFPQTGIYTISLELGNELGTTEISEVTTLVLTDSLLKPSFLVQVFDNIIQVTNTTQGYLNFFWWLNAGAPQGTNFSPYQFEVDSSGIYEVTLVASNECGAASTVISVPVIISGTTSLESLGWEVTVAPNPTSGLSQLTIEAPLGEVATLTILNALGQVIAQQPLTIHAGLNNIPVDISSFAAGAYYLQLKTPRGVSVLKVVKNQR